MLCTGKIEVKADPNGQVSRIKEEWTPGWCVNGSRSNYMNREDYTVTKCKAGEVYFLLDHNYYIERNNLKQQMMDGLVVNNLKLSSDGKIIGNKAYENIENYIKEKITHDGFRYDFYMQEVEDGNYRSWGKEIQAYYEMRHKQEECDDGSELVSELEDIADYVADELENNGHKVYIAIYECDDMFFKIYATSLNSIIKALQEYMSDFTCARLTEEYKIGCKRMTTPKDVYDVVSSLEYKCSCDCAYGMIWVNNTFERELAKVEKTYTVDDELAKIDLILKAVKENDKREGIKNKHENAETMLIMNEICTEGGRGSLDNNELLALMRTAQLLAKKDKANVVRLDLHKLWLVPMQIEFDFKNNIMAKASRYTQDDFKQEELYRQ